MITFLYIAWYVFVPPAICAYLRVADRWGRKAAFAIAWIWLVAVSITVCAALRCRGSFS